MNLHEVAAARGEWRDGVERGGAVPSAGGLSVVADLLDAEPASDVIPPMWHPAAFATWPAMDSLGRDGHPEAGLGFPPFQPRRRLFAGGRLTVRRALSLAGPATWERRVTDVTVKSGASGDLMFVTLETRYRDAAGNLALVDEQTLAYRGTAPAASGSPASSRPASRRPTDLAARDVVTVATDPVLLFRFSSATGNSHRIHYDERYAREQEGLPGRLVHAPLMAMLALEPVRRQYPDRQVESVAFRALRPALCGQELSAYIYQRHPESGRLEVAVDGEAASVLTGTVTLREPPGDGRRHSTRPRNPG
jgi:3-methylfumaryl-CoA hydratase